MFGFVGESVAPGLGSGENIKALTEHLGLNRLGKPGLTKPVLRNQLCEMNLAKLIQPNRLSKPTIRS